MLIDLPIALPLRDMHRNAADELNCWRGTCVDHYARIETWMAKAVAAMRAHPDGLAIKRPTLFGGFVAALTEAVTADGLFASAGADVRVAFEEAAATLAERNILIHATGRVLIDAHGAWVWLYRYQPTGENKPLVEGFITKNKANSREKLLHQSRDDLKEKLKQFADRLAKREGATDPANVKSDPQSQP